MDILYKVNKKDIDMMLASIYSIYLNGHLDELNFHIVYSDLNINDILYVENFLKGLYHVYFQIYYFDERDLEKYHIFKGQYSHMVSAQLFFSRILKDKVPEKLLYLSVDTICVGDMRGIKEYSIFPIYAAKDLRHEYYYQRFGQIKTYFNSGVLYMDTNKWEDINAESRIIDFIHHNPYELLYPDQDILNNALGDVIGELGIEYNLPPHAYIFDENMQSYYHHRSIRAEEIFEARKKAKICHSYGLLGIEPWSNNNVNPYNDLFMEYILMVNPHFQRENLEFFKMLYSHNRKLFNMILMTSNKLSSLMVAHDDKVLVKNLQNKNTSILK